MFLFGGASSPTTTTDRNGQSPPNEVTPLVAPRGGEETNGKWSVTSLRSNNGILADSSLLMRLSERIRSVVEEHTGSIGMLGSMAIATNSLTGPAMLNLPATFGRSGIIPTIVTLLFVCCLSALCALHMANTISKVPGNQEFQKNVEYSQAFSAFWGPRWERRTQFVFYCCVTCLNISSIVDTSQIVDTFLAHWWPHGGTAALDLTAGSWVRWSYANDCSAERLESCLPFDNDGDDWLLTAGNLIVTVVFLPLALMDLDENAGWQILGFLILIVTSLQFVVTFALSPDLSWENASWWGHDWGDLLGVVLFNFALVIAVPAWLYEREAHVDVATVVHSSSVLSFVLYISLGILGSLAMPHVADNMLESMMSGELGTAMQLGASIFSFAIIGLGIPLFSVLTRLNLLSNPSCSLQMGNALAVYLPFVIAWFLNDGAAVTALLGWGGVIFTSLVVFILPIVLAIHTIQDFDAVGSVPVPFFFSDSKGNKLWSLYFLLFLSVCAVVAAIGGNLWSSFSS